MPKAHRSLRTATAGIEAAQRVPEMAENAARDAYYAAFHAAKALIFERSERVHKTHGGVHREFGQIASSESAIDPATRSFLLNAYRFKSVADYDTSIADAITANSAAEAVDSAHRFVSANEAIIES